MKKKLSILANSLAGGGAERVIAILLDEMQDVFDITLVLIENKIEYDIPSGIKVSILSNSNPKELGIFKFLRLPYLGWKYKKFCQKNHIDVSLAFMNRSSYVSVIAKQLGNHVRTLISERSTPSKLYHYNNSVSLINKYLIRTLYPLSDTIITNSRGNAIDLVEHFSIDSQKIKLLYNPFDIEKIKNATLKSVEEVAFDRFTFITVGRLDEGKNHQMLIEAFYRLNLKDAQLLILGEGHLYPQLKEKIKHYHLEKDVILLGFTKNPYKYLAKSDVFLFSSRYEGFPNVIVEAMICGLPILSTDCPYGPREILFQTDENTNKVIEYGILTEVDNLNEMMCAMQKIYENSGHRKRLAIKSQERLSIFNKSEVLSSWILLLNQ